MVFIRFLCPHFRAHVKPPLPTLIMTSLPLTNPLSCRLVAMSTVMTSTWQPGGTTADWSAAMTSLSMTSLQLTNPPGCHVNVITAVVISPCCTSVDLGGPVRSVVLLDSASSVGEPRRYLRQRHLGDDCQHDLLGFGRVRILDVLIQPGLQRPRRLATGALTPNIQRTIAVSQTQGTN